MEWSRYFLLSFHTNTKSFKKTSRKEQNEYLINFNKSESELKQEFLEMQYFTFGVLSCN